MENIFFFSADVVFRSGQLFSIDGCIYEHFLVVWFGGYSVLVGMKNDNSRIK